jgi:hypothetical protein
MTAAEWAILIPAVAGVLGAVASWLRAQAAHTRIDALEKANQPKQAGSQL